MSRCKVVDLSSMSPEEQQQAMRQHAEPAKPPAKPPAESSQGPAAGEAFSGLGRGFLGGKGELFPQSSSASGLGLRDEVFDSLIAGERD